MNRPVLIKLVDEAALLAKRTRHLTEVGKPVQSLALQLAAEREKDPLRKLLEGQNGKEGIAEI
jgi:hypothetical protein